MDRDTFLKTARERFTQSDDFLHDWRNEARDDYDFIAGKQWLDEDERILKAQKRPPITFNYSEKMVDAVVGAEVSARNEVTFLPRGLEDSPLAELWTNAARWAREECNAEDEETEAFRDTIICGLGWTRTRMDYEEDADGMIVTTRVDPLEMRYDPAATRPGLIDRRYQYHLYWIDNTEIQRVWPDTIVGLEDENSSTGVITQGHRYEDSNKQEADRHRGQSQLRFYECVEKEAIYRVASQGKIVELSPKELNQVKPRLDEMQIPYVKQAKRVYYRAFFANDTLLGKIEKSPCQEGFTYQAITGKRDRNRGYWYGITKVMKDPQRWANKWLSQILHIINTNAKGGLLAEQGAFLDPEKAQDEWAEPDSITLLKEGGITKIKEKAMTAFPAGLDKLMSFALESLPMVTGINLEALGLANREQAGVLEAQRKQAAYGLLAPLFDALRRYRKNQGKILLFFINHFISDGRLIRIGGPDSAQFVPLTKAQDAIEYDIVVDQAPNSPDSKQKTWEALTEVLPAMLKSGVPIPPAILDYTPLPYSLASKWKQYIEQNPPQGAEQAQQAQKQLQQMQQQMQQMQQENQQLKLDRTADVMDMQNKIALRNKEFELKKQEIEQKMQLETYQANQEMRLNQDKASQDAAMKEKQVKGDLRIKAMSAQVSDDGDGGQGQPVGGLLMDDGDFKDAMAQMAQMMKQTQDQNAQVLSELSQALSRPRKLITDATGRPIGSAPVESIQ